VLTVNGSSQNAHPFDDFHILIGLMPVLAHDDPERTLAIGMGAGSTTFAMLQDPRVDHVVTVELCGEQYDLLHGLADAGRVDFQRMFADDRYDPRTGDGRKFLLADEERYDVITVDTLRPTAAFSGSLYSSSTADRGSPHATVCSRSGCRPDVCRTPLPSSRTRCSPCPATTGRRSCRVEAPLDASADISTFPTSHQSFSPRNASLRQ
jgi:hypothetical protein